MRIRSAAQTAGFTLVELLVAMGSAIVLVGAIGSLVVVTLHGQSRSASRNRAQADARLAIDLISRQLRNIASPISVPKLIERAGPYDLVFQTVAAPAGSNTGGAERVRYCIPNDTPLGSNANEVLIGQTQTWTTASPPGIPWNTTACPDTSASGASGQWRTVVPTLTNRYQGRTDRPAFTYDNGSAPSDLTQITSVQIDLFVNNPNPAIAADETELRSAVFLRNQVRAPVANFTETAMGGGEVLLNGATSYDPDGADLNYDWTCTSAGCPSTATLANSTGGLVVWHPGPGTYTVVLTVTDPTGLADTSTQVVTVT